MPIPIHVLSHKTATFLEQSGKRLTSKADVVWSQKLSETVTEVAKLKVFLGEHAP